MGSNSNNIYEDPPQHSSTPGKTCASKIKSVLATRFYEVRRGYNRRLRLYILFGELNRSIISCPYIASCRPI